jgi:zinc protease
MNPLRTLLRPAAAALLALALARTAAAAPVQLPPYTRTHLKNGLTVYVMPSHRLPLVELRLMARTGAVDDPAGKEGLASLMADLLTQGAGRRDARAIAGDIAFVGGSLEAAAGDEETSVACEVLTKDLATGLELFHDVIVLPAFPAEEFARKQEEALGGIAAERDDPAAIADDAIRAFTLGGHPLAHPVIGREASVESLTRDDVAAFHRAHVTPDNAALAVVGDVDAPAVLAQLERVFADWKPAGGPHPASYGPIAPRKRAVRIVDKHGVTQTQIRLLGLGVPRDHPDYFPIAVANTILGGGFTSRLVDHIRVDLGLTYGISSRFAMYRQAGTFGIRTFTKNESVRRAIDETLKVVDSLVTNGPGEEELAKAKRYLTGQFPLGLQAPDDLAEQLLDIDFFGLDPHFVETFSERVDGVTMADCRRALKSYFGTSDLRIVVVSDPGVMRPALEGLGPIDVVPVE